MHSSSQSQEVSNDTTLIAKYSCFFFFSPTNSTAASLNRERAFALPAIVKSVSFPLHLSTVCPQVPLLLPASTDLTISSLDDNSSPWDKWYPRFKRSFFCVYFVILKNFHCLQGNGSWRLLETNKRLQRGQKESVI